MTTLHLATSNGLVIVERNKDEWREQTRGLTGSNVTCLTASNAAILAGTTGGIFRSTDHGQTWNAANVGLTTPHLRWLASPPDLPGLALAGTEPAAIFISHDDGATWRACPEVTQLRDRHKWFLPYSPEAGCVRGFAFHGQRIYAAVEVGGVLRSDDGGETWRLAEGSDGNPSLDGPLEPFIYPDIHSLAVHPSSPDLIFAPTGGGFYRSNDGGKTWAYLYDCYCRAVWSDPADPGHLILGPADSVDVNGRIEATHDGGQTWAPASTGLQVPWRRHMVERFVALGDELLAMLSNGQLLIASFPALAWRQILPEIKDVQCVLVVES
jgi:photosystem II stability/assembly factor-like uncharacterized protein